MAFPKPKLSASLEERHFHTEPRSAHANRIRWMKRFPEVPKDIDMLWGAYGALGYEGADGKRAKKALEAMEEGLRELGPQRGSLRRRLRSRGAPLA